MSADLQKWFGEYAELMFPDASSIDESDQRGNDARYQEARNGAMWIVDRLIETGAHRNL